VSAKRGRSTRQSGAVSARQEHAGKRSEARHSPRVRGPYIGKLHTVGRIRGELVKLYRLARRGELSSSDAFKPYREHPDHRPPAHLKHLQTVILVVYADGLNSARS